MAVERPGRRVLDQFLGDEDFPIEWASEREKQLFWVFDDLHCPHPLSPMFYDIGGWWLTCDHMFRRFGTPFAADWITKNVNGYLYTAAVPADPAWTVDAMEYGARYGARVPLDPGLQRADRQVPGRDAARLRRALRRLVARAARAGDGAQLRVPGGGARPTGRDVAGRSSRCCSRTRSTSTTATGRSTGCSTSPSSRRRSSCAR